MPQARLFGSRLSPFVEKVARALDLKRIPFDIVPPHGPRDFGKWNPQTGKMPVLELGGERLYDSTFILRHVDRRHPDPPLFSADATVAAQQRMLEDWSDEALYWYVMALRWTDDNRRASAKQILDTLPPYIAAVARFFLPRQLRGTTLAQGLGRLPHEVALREFGERMDDLVRILAAKPFFYGDRPSAADLAIYGQLNTLCSGPTPDAAQQIHARSPLVGWMRRVEAATKSSG